MDYWTTLATNGIMNVQLRGVRTIFHGALQPLATMRRKDGASVQCKVKLKHRGRKNEEKDPRKYNKNLAN